MASILVVEDDAAIRSALIEALATEGYPTIQACDGLEALEVMISMVRFGQTPAWILLDINMPNVNGIEFVGRIRKSPGLSAVPITLLSGNRTLQEQAKQLNVDYISKPIDLAMLFNKAAEYCRGA